MSIGDIIVSGSAVSFFMMILISVFANEIKLRHFLFALIPGVIVSVLLAFELFAFALTIIAVTVVIYIIIGIYFERKG